MGSMINFGIGHFLGERVVRKLVRCETYEKYNQMVQYKGILVIFIFFLIPGFPKDIISYLFGLSPMPFWVFALVSTLGRAPGTWILSAQGGYIAAGHLWRFAALVAFLAALLPTSGMTISYTGLSGGNVEAAIRDQTDRLSVYLQAMNDNLATAIARGTIAVGTDTSSATGYW